MNNNQDIGKIVVECDEIELTFVEGDYLPYKIHFKNEFNNTVIESKEFVKSKFKGLKKHKYNSDYHTFETDFEIKKLNKVKTIIEELEFN